MGYTKNHKKKTKKLVVYPANSDRGVHLGVHQAHAKPPNQEFLLQPPAIPVAASKDPAGWEAFCHLWRLQYCCFVAEH